MRKKPRDKQRTYLCPDEIYWPAMAAAQLKGEFLSDVNRRALKRYYRDWGADNKHDRDFLRQLWENGELDAFLQQHVQAEDASSS